MTSPRPEAGSGPVPPTGQEPPSGREAASDAGPVAGPVADQVAGPDAGEASGAGFAAGPGPRPAGPHPDRAADGAAPRYPGAAVRAIALTHAALWWEAAAAAFWPAASLGAAGLAALALGLLAALPGAGAALAVAVWIAAVTLALALGTLRFRRPGRAQAEARVDARLPGRPLAVLGDRMAAGGPAAAPLWRAHLAWARQAASAARPVGADAGLSRRDPFGLRLAGLTAAAMALIFGGAAPARQGLAALAGGGQPPRSAPAAAPGPAWEAWARPPAMTGLPTLYLNALPGDALTLPQGSRVSLRLYERGVTHAQDIGEGLPGTDPAAPEFTALHSGVLSVGDRRFSVTVLPDAAPTVRLTGIADRRADGRLAQGFAAADDHGVVRGRVEIALDLPAVDRRYGLAVAPEPRPPLTLDLPLGGGRRPEVAGTLAADLAQDALANLPVTVSLMVEDGIGQAGRSEVRRMVLPGRRFFDPLAAALVELRRDLLWSRANAPRSAALLRAALWQPEGIAPPVLADLRQVIAALESAPLEPAARDDLARRLWQAALAVEDGGLGDALTRMQQAQQRLSEAMRRGASPDEIRKLMDELRAATDAYTRMLAQRGDDPAARFDRSPAKGREITGDQIQRMMDEIARLMAEGRTAEAQELLDQFQRMMEALRVRPGEGNGDGQGQGQGQGQQRAMDRLADALRRQQRLADEAMREAQRNPFGLPPEGAGEQGGEGAPGGVPGSEGGAGAQGGEPGGAAGGGGQQPGPRDGAPGSPGGGETTGQAPGAGADDAPPQGTDDAGGGSLADRQRALRDELGRQRALLPGPGTPAGDDAARRLDQAGQAMGAAEQALRQGDAMGAMESQADAIEAMREGMRALGRARRDEGREEGQAGGAGQDGQPRPGQGDQPGSDGAARSDGGEGAPGAERRDPLGRDASGQGTITRDGPLADGATAHDRARGLQDEIRRRSGEPQRPRAERDYLGRLLEPD